MGGWDHLPSCPLVLTAELALPLHLVVQEGGLVKEVAHFAALLVLLGGGEEPVLGLLCQELADAGHREHNLLHAAVLPHNLHTWVRSHSWTETFIPPSPRPQASPQSVTCGSHSRPGGPPPLPEQAQRT